MVFHHILIVSCKNQLEEYILILFIVSWFGKHLAIPCKERFGFLSSGITIPIVLLASGVDRFELHLDELKEIYKEVVIQLMISGTLSLTSLS